MVIDSNRHLSLHSPHSTHHQFRPQDHRDFPDSHSRYHHLEYEPRFRSSGPRLHHQSPQCHIQQPPPVTRQPHPQQLFPQWRHEWLPGPRSQLWWRLSRLPRLQLLRFLKPPNRQLQTAEPPECSRIQDQAE